MTSQSYQTDYGSTRYYYGCDAGKYCYCDPQDRYYGNCITNYKNQRLSSSVKCLDCPAGYYCEGYTYDVKNPYSYNVPLASEVPTKKCGLGRYSSTGASKCSACPAGSYSASTGTSVCDKCPAGLSCPASSTTSTACVLCGKGKYSTPGTACLSCQAGSHASSVGMSECAVCEPGTFSSAGSVTCSDCDAGKYSTFHAASCRSCPAGTYGSTLGRSDCAVCEPGTFSSAGSVTCSDCDAGKYSTFHAASCRSCPPGTFSRSQGQPQCDPCPAGTFSSTTGASICTACTNDHFSVPGATSCQTCDA